MGGHGSGRFPRGTGKGLVENVFKIDINDLIKEKILLVNTHQSGYLPSKGDIFAITDTTQADMWTDVCYSIYNGERQMSERAALTSTKPSFGGKRYWFICPLCGRRTRTLYILFHVGCRNCQGLVYASTRGKYRSHF